MILSALTLGLHENCHVRFVQGNQYSNEVSICDCVFLFPRSPQCPQLYPLQWAYHFFCQHVLGRAQTSQWHNWRLPSDLWALHSHRWWETQSCLLRYITLYTHTQNVGLIYTLFYSQKPFLKIGPSCVLFSEGKACNRWHSLANFCRLHHVMAWH